MSKTKSTEQIVSLATNRLAEDITTLATRRDSALSIFRQTANSLGTINNELTEKITQLDAMTTFLASQRDSASQQIADNEAVRSRILEILGDK